ncbi:hypothetical protein BTHE68_41930 [Burkholderia sp. THE68]|nr:hypothetical protein BTHE68_41930 [Burkholderia sp. THE68]
MERVRPWNALAQIIGPQWPRSKTGRPPFPNRRTWPPSMLLYGDEEVAFGYSGYRGVDRRPEAQLIAMMPGKRRMLNMTVPRFVAAIRFTTVGPSAIGRVRSFVVGGSWQVRVSASGRNRLA